jgi:hypothetical protein
VNRVPACGRRTEQKVLRKVGGEGITLHVVYEVEPTGFVIYRRLQQLGIDGIVVAPTKTRLRRCDGPRAEPSGAAPKRNRRAPPGAAPTRNPTDRRAGRRRPQTHSA